MRLRTYFKGYWPRTILGAFFKFLEAMFELITPLFMAILIDNGIANRDVKTITRMAIYILIFTIVGYIFSLLCQYLASVVGQGFGGKLRRVFFKKINTFSKEEYNKYSTATLTNRMTTDINQVQWGVAMGIRQATRAPIIMIGSIILTAIINIKIALIMLAALPVFIIVLVIIMKTSARVYTKSLVESDKMLKITNENLKGTRIIRAFSSENYEKSRFEESHGKFSKIQERLARVTSLSNPLTSVLMNILLVVLVYTSARLVFNGAVKQGQVMAIVNYCMQMMFALIVFMNMVIIYSRAFASGKRVREILAIKPKIIDKENVRTLTKGPLILEFIDTSYSYDDTRNNDLDGINIHIPFGKTIGVIGPTGSGKTTFLNLIPRYLEVLTGSIQINGKDISNYSLQSLRECISYVSQQPSLITGTIRSNITMGRSYSDEQIYKALHSAQALDIVNDKELGLEELVHNKGANFSGGQKQRLSLARAIIKEAPILLLDDTFSALDFLTDQNLRQSLKDGPMQTLIIVSQRISSIIDADEILVFDKGKIINRGNHQELLKTSKLYSDIYQTQEEGN